MAKREVLLTIKGKYDESVDDSESVELRTEGYSYLEENCACLSYEESSIYGLEGTTTTIRVCGDQVSIIRLGTLNSVMDFELNQRNVTLYSTPYGEMQIGIITNAIDVKYTENGLVVYLKINYEIEIGKDEKSANSIEVKVQY